MTAPARRTPSRGVTLLELLAVLVIFVMLAVLVMPGLQGLVGSSNLKASANLLLDELDLARQTADARNLPVDVRLYQDRAISPDGNGNSPYRLLALVIPSSASSTGSDEFLMAPRGLPGDVIVDSGLAYSSLLNTGLGAAGLRPTAGTELVSAPATVRNLPYVEFTFLANGTVDLDTSQQWCLTLINENKALKNPTGAPAANFVTLIVDPQTSHARMYQP
ncbi:MAG TPA: Verru_Chthon cassette protein D [Candidatus Methylacidiphilales bacterium]|nr:Verru_Chthon cassette protein D [Candidatus Methylacidiphilales bacterium]